MAHVIPPATTGAPSVSTERVGRSATSADQDHQARCIMASPHKSMTCSTSSIRSQWAMGSTPKVDHEAQLSPFWTTSTQTALHMHRLKRQARCQCCRHPPGIRSQQSNAATHQRDGPSTARHHGGLHCIRISLFMEEWGARAKLGTRSHLPMLTWDGHQQQGIRAGWTAAAVIKAEGVVLMASHKTLKDLRQRQEPWNLFVCQHGACWTVCNISRPGSSGALHHGITSQEQDLQRKRGSGLIPKGA